MRCQLKARQLLPTITTLQQNHSTTRRQHPQDLLIPSRSRRGGTGMPIETRRHESRQSKAIPNTINNTSDNLTTETENAACELRIPYSDRHVHRSPTSITTTQHPRNKHTNTSTGRYLNNPPVPTLLRIIISSARPGA